MYNISLFTQYLDENKNIVKIAGNQTVFRIQEIFCDKNSLVNYDTPIFHSYFLIGENKLVLADSSAYRVADVFNSNQFICIDESATKPKDLDNVDFYNLEDINPENIDNELLKILQQEKYDEYRIQQIN